MSELNGPRQVILVTSRGKVREMGKEGEKDNVMAVAWHMPVSFEPKLYAIAIGKERFSHGLIEDSGVFVVNFVGAEGKEKVVFCGTVSGKGIDKIKEAGLEIEEGEKVDCGRLKGSLGFLECKVVDRVEAGDHTIFVGRVLKKELRKKGKRLFHVTGKEFREA